MNETTIAYNSQKSGYLAKCWDLTMIMTMTMNRSGLCLRICTDGLPYFCFFFFFLETGTHIT